MQNETKKIPDSFDYSRLTSLSKEGMEKLIKIKPASLGQASRISGVSASDVSIISLFLK
jgi:tRNA uridine 5-carboxymethylaminomethyl modification enzyme